MGLYLQNLHSGVEDDNREQQDALDEHERDANGKSSPFEELVAQNTRRGTLPFVQAEAD